MKFKAVIVSLFAALAMLVAATPAAAGQLWYRCDQYIGSRVVASSVVSSTDLGWFRAWHPGSRCGCIGYW